MFGLDPFGHKRATDFMRQLHQRCRHRLACRIGFNPARQHHVHFEDIGLQIDDMPQARIAGPDIVDSDLGEGFQRGDFPRQHVEIVDLAVFGNFHDEVLDLDRFEQFAQHPRSHRRRRDVDGGVDAVRNVSQRIERAAHGGHFQFLAQTHQFGIVEPGIGAALGEIGEAREAFDAHRPAGGKFDNRLLESGNAVPIEHRFNSNTRLLIAHFAFERAFDAFGGEPGETLEDRQVALVHGAVGIATESAETAPDGAVRQAERGVDMAAHGQEIGDRQRLGQREIGRILDQFGQTAIENVPAIARLTRIAEAGAHRQIEIAADMRQFALLAFDVAGDKGDFDTQMPAHSGEDAFDSGVVHQFVGERAGGCLEVGQLQCGLGHARLVPQIR